MVVLLYFMLTCASDDVGTGAGAGTSEDRVRYVWSRDMPCLEYMFATIYNMCITQCISCLYITACAVADGKEWLG
jgi:hypothetical protein